MAIKDILVHLDPTARSNARLDFAARLAAAHGAHLTGLAVLDLPPPDVFYGFPSTYMDVQSAEEVVSRLRAGRMQELEVAKARFETLLAQDGIAGEWRVAEGDPAETTTLHARYADLVIVGQPAPDDDSWLAAAPSVAGLMGAGRPILVMPYAGAVTTLAETVLVGWNATAEAARAVNEALPLLQRARKVTVLAINPRRGIAGDGDLPAADIARHLARHGVQAEAAHTIATDLGEGDALLSYAADIGADLLVCGMYGHTRLREFAFGGVTRTLLSTMTLPVFLSH